VAFSQYSKGYVILNLICKVCKKKLASHPASVCLDRTIYYLLSGELVDEVPEFSTSLEWALVALGVSEKAATLPEGLRLLRNKVNESSLFIFLTQDEVREAEEIGVQRNQAKTKFLRNQFNLSNVDNETVHIRGALSEIAFAKISNHLVNRDLYKTHGDETDFDGIDIKGASHRGADVELKVPVKDWENKPQNYYILSRFFAENYGQLEIVGGISNKTFDEVKVMKKYSKYGPQNYIAGASKLTPIDQMQSELALKSPLEICQSAISNMAKAMAL